MDIRWLLKMHRAHCSRKQLLDYLIAVSYTHLPDAQISSNCPILSGIIYV